VTYYYQIKAGDAVGNLSLASNEVFATPYDTLLAAPGRPTLPERTNIVRDVEYINKKNLIFTWAISSSPNISGYRVYIGSRSGEADLVNGADIATNSFATNINADGRYFIRVRAYNASGMMSSYSAELQFVIDTIAPKFEANLTVTSDGNLQILTFPLPKENGSGIWGYKIYKNSVLLNPSADGFSTGISQNLSDSSLSLIDRAQYDASDVYRVVAVDLATNQSSEMSATPVLQSDHLVILGVRSDPTTRSAKIYWTTNLPAAGYLEYGFTDNYGNISTKLMELQTSHSLTLYDLLPDTVYHFRVVATDASDYQVVSADYQFKTSPSNTSSILAPTEDPIVPATAIAVTAGLAAAAAAAGPIGNAMTIFSLQEYLRSLFMTLFPLTVGRRKRKEWGRVIEVGSNIGIPQVKLDLVKIKKDEAGNFLPDGIYQTTFSDKEGKYAFIAEPGYYEIHIQKDLFHLVESNNTYRLNTIIKIKDSRDSLVVPDILMSMDEKIQRVRGGILINLLNFERILTYASIVFMLLGSILVVRNLMKDPTDRLMLLVAFVYVVFWCLNIRALLKASSEGHVREIGGKNLPLALVRVVDEKTGRLSRTAATNEDGAYRTVVSKGVYDLRVAKSGFEQLEKARVSTSKDIYAINKTIRVKSTSDKEPVASSE
jgi:hypothetical protein